ncbi:WD repeat-containing protein 91 homolog isoform X2 [Salvia hispanica]|uniref:WD repeat-containing protein 91 homolog isoform X2 n=1 Tax=Salvia hispanica TaxID=49212 RepID=UPI002009BFB8|nr:WD repeat-containing protein 91 homolog isoform X2 [Salvia hispanica]
MKNEGMEKMKFAEELVREFLVFRGFTNTLQSFEKELATDIGKGFQVDKILDLIFSVYIPKFEAAKLIELLSFFRNCFSYSDPNLIDVISKLHQSILRYYVVYALKCGRKDAVLELFRDFGNELMRGDESWTSWFAVPYFQNPHLEPQFRVYFSDEWFRTLHLSVRNFLSEMLNGTRTPALLKIGSERDTVNRLKQEIKQLSLKLSQAQTLLEETEAQICLFRSSEAVSIAPSMTYETHASLNEHADDNRSNDIGQGFKENSVAGSSSDLHNEEDFPEVKTVFEDTFLGHTSPINCSRFSASGDNIASASVDGTVRIWTYDSSAPTSRNATIYCGAEIMSLEWDCKSDRLLLIGTSDGGIKAWNVDAKRVVCDLNTSEAYPSILDLKCSPVEPIFVSAAASGRQGSGSSDSLGFASLTVWNMRTWKAMTVLPLGKDPPAITSLSFNHNGKLLAAAATDGLIHMFDMSSYQQVTGWPAHDCGISSILFGPDETSIFSLGTDGNIFEWSLHNQGKVLWSRNCSRFCNLENSSQWRHQMALDSEGRRLLVTSSSERSPIYQVRGRMSGMRSLAHKGSITTVDWHPHLPIFLTGSSDHSVRVSSISS